MERRRRKRRNNPKTKTEKRKEIFRKNWKIRFAEEMISQKTDSNPISDLFMQFRKCQSVHAVHDWISSLGHDESIDVREGASGASADVPGVGLEMVSGLKFPQKNENK